MFLKVMSDNKVENNTFQILANVASVEFRRYSDQPGESDEMKAMGDAYALVSFVGDTESRPTCVPIPGQAYVLNESGLTIERFGSCKWK